MASGVKANSRVRWRIGLVGLALGVVLAAAGVMIVPEWAAAFDRPARRELIDGCLRAIGLVYGLAWAITAPGALILGWRVARSRRWGRRRLGAARGLAVCVSSLCGLAVIELSAALWLARLHRVPRWVGRFENEVPATRPHRLAPEGARPGLPEQFQEEAAGPVHLVVIGESSAEGFPYHPWLSIGQIVAWKLGEARPDRQIELEILAQGGANLEDMHHALARLKTRPEILIVYAGHNEFQARFPWSRTILPSADSSTSATDWPRWLGRWSPFCRLLNEARRKNRLDEPPPLVLRRLVDGPVCTKAEAEEILADFERRLEAIVADCERVGCLPVLVIPPGNDADFEPSRSVLPESVGPVERQEFGRAVVAAMAAEAIDPARAEKLYRALIARQPGFAETHYRLARLLEWSGRWAEADRHYILARDADGLPLRCPSPFHEAYRRVARRHDCPLIDGPSIFRAIAPRGIVGEELFHDAHHPTLRGHVALAEAVLRALHERGVLGGSEVPKLDPAACVAQFGLGTRAWASVCERSSTFYRNVAVTRFLPFERLARARRYDEASEALRAGRTPEQARIPGGPPWSLHRRATEPLTSAPGAAGKEKR
jgi:hypothetical protein